MVDQAMDLWIVKGLGFTPVPTSEVQYYIDPDLAAQAAGFPAGGGLSFYGNQGMADNWYTEASYPIGSQMYPLGGATSSLAPVTGTPLTLGLSAASQPSGISWTKISAFQVGVVLAAIVVLYLLWKRHQAKGNVAAGAGATQ